MPNRILKESICTSDSVDLLSWFEEVLFYRLIVNCDDFGRYDGRAAVIRGKLFPLKSVTNKQISDAVNKLAAVGMIILYDCDGKPYLQLVNWESHQQIRAKKSKYPAPCENVSDIICNQMISNDIKCSRNPIQSESNPNPNTKSAFCEHFEKIWSLYPNKRGKGQISDLQKQKLAKISFEEMKRAIERYESDLKKEEWRKPQNGSTFFNSGYIDYLDENYIAPQVITVNNGQYDFEALEKAAMAKVVGGQK